MEEIDEMLSAAEKDFANGEYVTNEEVLELVMHKLYSPLRNACQAI